MSTPTPELNKALAAFQANLPAIAKGETVEVPTKAGGKYTYTYADLADVSDAVLPHIGKHGLAFTAMPGTDTEGRLVLDYALIHESGEERPAQFPLWMLLPERVTAQQIGGYITYARRYCLCAAAGVAPGGEDNDAATTEVKVSRPRYKTAHADPEHQRLQNRRQPGDRPAERGPTPPDEDLWAGQPAGEYTPTPTSLPDRRTRPHTPAQMIAMHWKRLGITENDERLNWTARMAGLPELASTTALPPAQQQEILTALAACKDISHVQAWVDKKQFVS
jgi:ERF superfamily